MKIIAQLHEQPWSPLIKLYLHYVPHRRQHNVIIQKYREALYKAIAKTGFRMPYGGPIELDVVLVNPESPDLGNSYLMIERCFDGKALKPPFILDDDSQIQVLHMTKMYTPGKP